LPSLVSFKKTIQKIDVLLAYRLLAVLLLLAPLLPDPYFIQP